MPQNDEYQLTFVQSVHATRLTHVLVYQQTSGDGVDDALTALAEGFLASNAHASYLVNLGDEWSGLCAEVRQLNNQGQDFFRVLDVGAVGNQGDTLNPATAAQLVFFPSNSGPGQQGSIYVAGVPVALEHKNNLDENGYQKMVTFAAQFLPPIVNSGYTFQMGLPSRPFIAADPGADPPIKGQSALPFRTFVLSDARVPLTKIRSRRLNTRC